GRDPFLVVADRLGDGRLRRREALVLLLRQQAVLAIVGDQHALVADEEDAVAPPGQLALGEGGGTLAAVIPRHLDRRQLPAGPGSPGAPSASPRASPRRAAGPRRPPSSGAAASATRTPGRGNGRPCRRGCRRRSPTSRATTSAGKRDDTDGRAPGRATGRSA